MIWFLLVLTLAVISTPASGAGLRDMCGGIVEVQIPLNLSYSGPVHFEGRLYPPTRDLLDECRPLKVELSVDNQPIGARILDLRQTGKWGWEAITKWTTKGCFNFLVAVTVDPECDPVTRVHSVASHFCLR